MLADIDKSEVEEVEDVKVATKQPKQKQTKIQFETKKQLKEDLADKNNKSGDEIDDDEEQETKVRLKTKPKSDSKQKHKTTQPKQKSNHNKKW